MFHINSLKLNIKKVLKYMNIQEKKMKLKKLI